MIQFCFLKKHLFDHIDYSESNLCFFDGESPDLEKECSKTDAFIQKFGPVDLMLLGVGMNGHLGLNEPGTPFELSSHIVNLDETTKKVGKKYFSGDVKLSKGISLGLKYVIDAKTVIVQISGLKKAEVTRQLTESEITPDFPASVIKKHGNSFLLLDREAASYLQQK